MLRNYFLIWIRSFRKDRTNAFISLLGLTVGLTCVLLIIGYIRYETSFESGYSNAPRIYQVLNKLTFKAESYTSAATPIALSPTLQREIPEIEAQTSLDDKQVSFFKHSGEIQKVHVTSVDNDFFRMFDFKFLSGNAKMAFKHPNALVLTPKGAKNLFGKIPALGTILYATDSVAYTVTGIIQNLPANTFFSAGILMNHPPVTKPLDYMAYNSGSTCIMLGKNNTIQQVKQKLEGLYTKYEFDNAKVDFMPVKNIHLRSSVIRDFPENYNISDIKYVYVYGSIALLILLIGCFNFINLTVARSLDRAKEIGVRKLFGAKRKQLIIQFLGESSIYFVVALPIALLLAILCWHPFNYLLNFESTYSFFLNYQSILLFTGISIIASLLCSLYPALFLSRLNPANTLKGSLPSGFRFNLGLRKALIIIQFAISIVLIVATLVVHAQLNFLNNQNLGFNDHNLIVLNFQDYGQKERAFKNELQTNPMILSTSMSRLNVGKTYGSTFTGPSPKDSSKGIRVATIDGDADFIKTLDVPVIEGKAFANNMVHTAHSSSLDSLKEKGLSPTYISKALLDVYDIKGNPVGREVKGLGAYVIGVIDDFKALSLKEKNLYVTIHINSQPLRFGYMYIKIAGGNTAATLRFIQKKWKTFFPKSAFDYSFVDERIAKLYDTETRLTKLFNIFALLAIMITCSGLFSLVSLMVRKRTKEIGVRKVMGATVSNIVLLISKEFVGLVILSFFVAMPFAYYALNRWLQNYAYKTQLSWWLFALAGSLALLIAFISISFKSVSAAKANPVASLRDE